MMNEDNVRKLISDKPNPGSTEAIELGCKCPVMDNRRGKGAHFDAFGRSVSWYSDACPIHADKPKEVRNENNPSA